LVTAGIQIPIIFITGHGDIPMSVQAMKAGAVGFLTKPFRQQDLLDAVQQAIGRDRAARDLETKLASLRACYELLTPREREVTACVVLGMLNKQIAAELGTTEKTIKFHRVHIMHKMMAKSLADLVRMAGHLELPGQGRDSPSRRSSRMLSASGARMLSLMNALISPALAGLS
jgi:FixJ family two-component response regulator